MHRPVALVAGVFGAVLTAVSGRYGFHRDELYFLAAGRHLAAGYPDQGLLVPLLARVFGHSLWTLRLPATVAVMTTVVLAAIIARELGASRRGQTVTAALTATCGIVVGTAHLFSTTTFDLTLQTAVLLVVLRLLREATPARWLQLGALVGVDLLVKNLVPFTLAGLLVGVLAVRRWDVLRTPWVVAAGLLALVVASPDLIWQASHGWPQLDVSSSIAHGGSGTSVSRPLFVPNLLLQASPPLLPTIAVGVRALWRARSPLPVAFAVTVVLFIATGGKPYYLAAWLPVFLAAGAEPTVRALRHRWVQVVLGLNVVVTAFIALPLVPIGVLHSTPIKAVNGDSLETVGWPAFARTIARVTSPGEVVLADNYGEAGALQRYGVADVYSGHNAYWLWGPPPDASTSAIVVGLDDTERDRLFAQCHQVARVDDGVQVDNDEQGEAVWSCTGLRGTWSQLWPSIKHYG